MTADSTAISRDTDTIGRTVVVLAGAAIAATAGLPWVRAGNGSTLDGLDLADALRNGSLAPSWGDLAGTAIYIIVAIGCVCVALAAGRHPGLAIARALLAAGIVVALLVVTLTGWFPPNRWDLGPTVCGLAAVVLAAASVHSLHRSGT